MEDCRDSKVAGEDGAWMLETLPLSRKPFIKPWMIDLADDHYEIDITRARTTVGWEPKHRLRDTLPKIAAAVNADPWTWYRENELNMPSWLTEVAPQVSSEARPEWEKLVELRELIEESMSSHATPVMRR